MSIALEQVKHLPARHDQKRHAGERAVVGERTVEFIDSPEQWRVRRDDFYNWRQRERALPGESLEEFDLRMLCPAGKFLNSSVKDPELVYRGISRAELRSILATGVVSSRGYYNFSSEQGKTVYADNPSTALAYATTFAPTGWQPRTDRPSYVLQLRRSQAMEPDPVDGYLKSRTPVPKDDIIGVWEVRPKVDGRGGCMNDYVYTDITDYIQSGIIPSASKDPHRDLLERAIEQGQDVPAEVLRDYTARGKEVSRISLLPWYAVVAYKEACVRLKQPTDELPDYVIALSEGTASYEKRIRDAWEVLKADPTEDNARAFTQLMQVYSQQMWPEVLKRVLGVTELSQEQIDFLQEQLRIHHGYIRDSLLPDIIKSLASLDSLDYRATALYAGALWSVGSLATVMFDGANVRDLADLFMFVGPNDEATCTGERGCARHVGQVYTVAQILENDIVPGRFRCMTNCRHFLLPVASPLVEKHLPARHD